MNFEYMKNFMKMFLKRFMAGLKIFMMNLEKYGKMKN